MRSNRFPTFSCDCRHFMEDLEKKAFVTYEEPRLWRRFGDDVIAIVTKETGKKSPASTNQVYLGRGGGRISSLYGCQLHAPVGWIADKTSVPETNTHQQIRLVQLSPPNESEGRHRLRFSGPAMGRRWIVSSNVLRRPWKEMDIRNNVQRRRSAESKSDQWRENLKGR